MRRRETRTLVRGVAVAVWDPALLANVQIRLESRRDKLEGPLVVSSIPSPKHPRARTERTSGIRSSFRILLPDPPPPPPLLCSPRSPCSRRGVLVPEADLFCERRSGTAFGYRRGGKGRRPARVGAWLSVGHGVERLHRLRPGLASGQSWWENVGSLRGRLADAKAERRDMGGGSARCWRRMGWRGTLQLRFEMKKE